MSITLPMSRFSYNNVTKLFVADISELQLHNVRDGITIQSPTGNTVSFELAESQRNLEGEVCYWTLLPLKGSVREDIAVVVFND